MNKSIGIGRKLILSFVLISLVTVAIMISLFYVAIYQYYINGMEQVMINHAEASAAMYNRYAPQGSIEDKKNYIYENMDINEQALVELYDNQGRFILNNAGENATPTELTDDYYGAMQGEKEVWTGRIGTKEDIMSVSIPIFDRERVVGVLRYVSSMSAVNEILRANLLLAAAIGFVILMIATFIGSFMSARILTPVKDLMRVTQEITNGNLNVQAKIYDGDEIGQLADAVNQMTDEIKRSNRARTDFVSSVSHELRTPLTSIKGWAETIEDSPSDIDTTRLGIDIIGHETNRLIQLVNNLLDFSKLQSHRIELSCEVMWIDEFLEGMYHQFSVRAAQEEVTLRLHLDSQNVEVFADENRLRQVFINVLDNSFKFVAGRSQPEIIIESHMLDDQVVMTIEDNGPGMTGADLLRVKQKFYKGSSNLSGTGLGLSIANEIVELHNGTMYVDSIRGYGTKVSVVLPIFEGEYAGLSDDAQIAAVPDSHEPQPLMNVTSEATQDPTDTVDETSNQPIA